MTLDEIAIKFNTDKASRHATIKGHDYARHYDRLFTPFRDAPIKFLEIGVGGGESIQTWLEYFTRARIFGVDIVSNTNPWNDPKSSPDPRYTFVQGSQTDPTMWECFKADHGNDFTIVVDDGGHASDGIIISYRGLWPALLPGGLYCIEDLATAYSGLDFFCPPGWPNHMTFLKERLDEVMQQDTIESIHCSKELAILRKQ